LAMLRTLVRQAGAGILVGAGLPTRGVRGPVQDAAPAAVLGAAGGPGGVTQARYPCRRLRGQDRGAKIGRGGGGRRESPQEAPPPPPVGRGGPGYGPPPRDAGSPGPARASSASRPRPGASGCVSSSGERAGSVSDGAPHTVAYASGSCLGLNSASHST